MNISIGIDPGIDTGGLAMIPENGEIKVIMTPRISAKGDIDLRAISSFFLDAADKIQGHVRRHCHEAPFSYCYSVCGT